MTFTNNIDSSVMKRLSREPLIHFLMLGAILFGAYAYVERKHGGAEQSKPIELTIGDISQLVQVFRSQWRRDPTPEELRQLVEDKAREEILYREALALGLDKDDTIVKRRMAQKMQFLAEDVAAAREPTVEELGTWYEANRDQFAFPPRVSFRHLYFSPDRRQAGARDDAAAALTKLSGQPEDSNLAATSADAFMFQDYYRDRTPEFLGKEFGPNFALTVTKLSPGSWQGPVESGFGWHLVFVDTLIPGRVPAFEEVEADVKKAWLAEQKALAWQKAYQDLRAKYIVLLPAPTDNASASGETSKSEQIPGSSRKGPS
jgi:parvulin-like peptidyl-prolyl isomerase